MIKESVPEGDEYVTQVRLILSAPYAAKGLLIEASADCPIRLEIHPGLSLQDAGMMMSHQLDESPNRKVVKLTPPLANGYIATAYATQPTRTPFRWELLP